MNLKNFAFLGPAQDHSAEIQAIFGHAALFSQWDRADIHSLCNFMSVYAAGNNTAVMRQGESPDHMLILLTGAAVSVHTDVNGASLSCQALMPGECFGALSMIDGVPLRASCLSTEPVDFALMTRQAFNDLMLTRPRLGNQLLLRLLHVVSERLQRAASHSPVCAVATPDL